MKCLILLLVVLCFLGVFLVWFGFFKLYRTTANCSFSLIHTNTRCVKAIPCSWLTFFPAIKCPPTIHPPRRTIGQGLPWLLDQSQAASKSGPLRGQQRGSWGVQSPRMRGNQGRSGNRNQWQLQSHSDKACPRPSQELKSAGQGQDQQSTRLGMGISTTQPSSSLNATLGSVDGETNIGVYTESDPRLYGYTASEQTLNTANSLEHGEEVSEENYREG